MNLPGRRDSLLLFLVLLLGLGVRLYHLDKYSLWGDEAFSWMFSESPLSFLWSTGMKLETNPPGYYTLLHFWMESFGMSTFSLRLPSVLASTVTILVIYLIGRELEGSAIGLLGALIFALAPPEIWFAQEVRAYACFHFTVAVTFLGLAVFLHRPGAWTGLILYFFGALGSIYTHSTAAFLIAACNFAVLTALIGSRPLLNFRQFLTWIACNAGVALLAIPQVLAMAGQVGSPNISWIKPLSAHQIAEELFVATRGPATDIQSAHGYSLYLLLALTLALALARPFARWTFTSLVLPLLLFLGLVMLASLKQPIFNAHSITWLWVPFSPLLALALLRPGVGRWILLPITLFFFAVNLRTQLFPHIPLRSAWPEVIARYKTEAAPGEALFINAWQIKAASLLYYDPEAAGKLSVWNPQPQYSLDYGAQFVCDRMHLPLVTLDDVKASIASGRPVSVILMPASDNLSGLPEPEHRLTVPVPSKYEVEIWSWGRPAGK